MTQHIQLRQPGLDGIRGFAALAVATMHLSVSFGLLPYSALGNTGVTVFFVLSGYLISRMWHRRDQGIGSYWRFVRRRLVRLGPVVVALALIGGPALVVFGGASAASVTRDAGLALLQLTAFASAAGSRPYPYFEPTWSLTVEWTFYLVFPLVFFLIRRSTHGGNVPKVLAGLGVALYLIGLPMSFEGFYFLPVANLGVMFVGAALGAWHSQRTEPLSSDRARTVMAMGMLGVLAVLPGYTLSWSWKLAVMPAAALAALALVHGVVARDRATAVLGTRFLSSVGRGAYSLYLWHMPVMWLVWFNTQGANKWLQAAIACVAIAGVSVLSFRALERPVLLTGDARSPSLWSRFDESHRRASPSNARL
jgi:peptidoglycan/LPS O-acetylase OafA/YrhL